MTQKYRSIKEALDLNSKASSVLVRMDHDHFPTPWSPESWDHIFSNLNQVFLLIVEENESILGFILFNLADADSFAHLIKIVVTPKARRIGLGKKLLAESVTLLCNRGIKSFFLEVEEQNDAAIKLYESQGFKIIHTKKQFYRSGANALIMTLDI